jgi:prolyl 4-hydroxylase
MLLYYIIFLLISIIIVFNYINTTPKSVSIEKFIDNSSYSPIHIYDNFISKSDCDYLINISQGQFKDSSIYSTPLGAVDKSIRSSKNSAFQRSENKIIEMIENKIIKLLNIQRNQIEPIQIVKYDKGNQYKPHYDYFSNITDNVKNQRIHSFIIYLNDLQENEGGATWFPLYRIRVYPLQARCLHFKNIDYEGNVNPLTLHCGEEILSDNVKYILTVWIRQYPYNL